jgi:hypothetical protein
VLFRSLDRPGDEKKDGLLKFGDCYSKAEFRNDPAFLYAFRTVIIEACTSS